MFGLGFSEIVALAILGLILIGPEQLPDMAKTLGKFINDLKRSTDDLTEDFKKHGFNDKDSKNFLDSIRKDIGDVAHYKEGTLEKLNRESAQENQNLAATGAEKETDGKKPESN